MVDRPIIFSAPMARALLDGRKTQTRRLAKNRKHPDFGCDMTPAELSREKQHVIDRAFPYGSPGDRLWVRENIRAEELECGTDGVRYLADDAWMKIDNTPAAADAWGALFYYRGRGKGRIGNPIPSIHMPRWASRLTLVIEQVRLERLQAITEEDAQAEGVEDVTRDIACGDPALRFWRRYRDGGWNGYVDNPVASYASLWSELHGPGAWEANPWVVALSFRVVRANIDKDATRAR